MTDAICINVPTAGDLTLSMIELLIPAFRAKHHEFSFEKTTLITTPENAVMAGRISKTYGIGSVIILGNLANPDCWSIVCDYVGFYSNGA